MIFGTTRLGSLLLIGALGLSACNKAPGYNYDGDDNAGGLYGGGGTGAGIEEGELASNPNSPRYFEAAVGDRIYFVVDQSVLTQSARATLAGQATWLRNNRDYSALIEGHADEQGTREYNLALGARRANAVREYLIGQGVDSAGLRIVSYGKERPIEICSAESCYSKNRRAVTVLSSGVPNS